MRPPHAAPLKPPKTCQHRNGQLRDHRQVEGHPIARLQPAEIPQQRRKLVDALIELLVRDDLGGLRLRLGDPDQRSFVPVFGEVPVDAVKGSVELPTHKPLPERRVARIERGVPVLVPRQEIAVFLEAFGEVLLGESFEDRGVVGVGLTDELRWRVEVLLLPPVDRNLGL